MTAERTKQKVMNVVIVDGFAMQRATIKNDLEAMQEFVGGWIETASMGDGYIVVCNEEGMLLGLPQNIIGVYGKCFICRIDEINDGEMRGLTNEEMTYVMQRISEDLLLGGEE